MICNIRDSRSRPFRWRRVKAILEATAHDNGCPDADPVPPTDLDVTCEVRDGISIPEAIAWAEAQPGAVTLFLYDEGDGEEEEGASLRGSEPDVQGIMIHASGAVTGDATATLAPDVRERIDKQDRTPRRCPQLNLADRHEAARGNRTGPRRPHQGLCPLSAPAMLKASGTSPWGGTDARRCADPRLH